MPEEPDPPVADSRPPQAQPAAPDRRRAAREGLDTRVALVPAGALFMAGAAALVLVAALGWAFLGTVRDTAAGTGLILQQGESFHPVQGLANGLVAGIHAAPGDQVAVGDLLVTLRDPLAEARLALSRGRIEDLAAALRDGRGDEGALRAALAEQSAIQRRLQAEYEAMRRIAAPVTGRVEELRVAVGQAADRESVLLTLAAGATPPAARELLGFLATSDAPRVRAGMPARVSPVTVPDAAYGAIPGTVATVSDLPVSRAAIATLLQDPDRAAALTARGEPYLVRIRLQEDPATPSGFAWTTGNGPPWPVGIGIAATVEVVVEEQAPIDLLLPVLRDLVP
ncbi:MAG: HlyD family efflux transporter periplasmic adaptor subunit [Sneathiellaceae bacterium]